MFYFAVYMKEDKRLNKYDLKREAILSFHSLQCLTFSQTVAVEKTAAEFYLSESRIWQILREENKRRQAQAV